MFGIRLSPTVTRERLPYFILYVLAVLEIAQPDYTGRDSSINGVIRTLSRIDGAFINIPMAEARDFHCYSHVFENLGKRSIPSDHAAVRAVFQNPNYSWTSGQTASRVGCPKHPLFCSILKRLDDDHQYRLVHLAHSHTSTLFSKRHEFRLFPSSHVRHLTPLEPSC